MEISTPHLDPPKAVVIAALLGSILSLSFIDDMGKRQRCVAVISGMIMAHYLAPLIAHVFNEDSYQETVGFLIGLFGMSICAAVFRAIKNSDLWGLIKSRFGKSDIQAEADAEENTRPPPGGYQ